MEEGKGNGSMEMNKRAKINRKRKVEGSGRYIGDGDSGKMRRGREGERRRGGRGERREMRRRGGRGGRRERRGERGGRREMRRRRRRGGRRRGERRRRQMQKEIVSKNESGNHDTCTAIVLKDSR